MSEDNGLIQSKDLQLLLSINDERIRSWCKEFASYLSTNATPDKKGTHRKFTREDVAVLALVKSMREDEKNYDSIHATLQSGARGDIPLPSDVSLSQVAISQSSLSLAMRMYHLEQENKRLMFAYNESQSKLNPAQEELHRMEGEMAAIKAQVTSMWEQLTKANEEARKAYAAGWKDAIGEKQAGNQSPPNSPNPT